MSIISLLLTLSLVLAADLRRVTRAARASNSLHNYRISVMLLTPDDYAQPQTVLDQQEAALR